MRLVSLRRSVRPPTYHTVHEAGVVQEVGEAGHVLQVLGVLPHLLHQLEALTLNTRDIMQRKDLKVCLQTWRSIALANQ